MGRRFRQQYEFGPFQLDTAERQLQCNGRPVPLTPKVFDLLEVLVRNCGHLVEKEDLLEQVWPDSYVEEGNLNRNVSILRKVLGKDSAGRPYIETVPKRGYRFVGSVRTIQGNDSRGMDPVRVGTHSQHAGSPSPLAAGRENDSGLTRIFRAHRRLIMGGLAALAVGILAYSWSPWSRPGATLPEIRSLAVLPLVNLSGDPAQEYFADGMTEALISSLAQFHALRVVSRTSVMRFKGSRMPLPEIGQDLKVDALVEGSVQRSGGRVKIMVQLIYGRTDTHLWARHYERELTDVLKLQGEVARAIADEIRIQVTAEQRARLASAHALDPAAHESYLLGRYHAWKYNEEDLKRAIEHFESAIQMDSDYAAAYADLALVWTARGIWGGIGFKEAEAPSRAAAQKALQLDDRLAAAYVASGRVKYFYDWDWTGGEKDIIRALELDPNNLDAHFNYALLLQGLGRFSEAIHHIDRAQHLDPLSSVIESNFGRILYRARKNEDAVQHLNRAIELEPRNYAAHGRLGDVHEQMGKFEKAIAFYQKAQAQGENTNVYHTRIARVYARMGKRKEAQQILDNLKLTTGLAGHVGINAATAYTALGDTDEAFMLLMKAIEQHDSLAIFIKEDPPFDPLRSDPRWKVLLRRMNLPAE